MRKLSIFLLIGVVAMLAAPVEADACEDTCENTVALIAGQNYDIGEVSVSCDSNVVTVTYSVDPGWCLAATHLFVGDTLPDKSAPGKLGLQEEHGCIQTYTYTVPVDDCDDIKIAAHADVLAWSLPIGGTVQYSVHFPGTDSYFSAWVTYDGVTDPFDAFCVDLAHTISSGPTYDATLYSTLDPNAPVDNPENLDLANWVLNNQEWYAANCGAGWQEIQGALWLLLDDSYSCPSSGICSLGSINFDVGAVNCVVADALANGEGFIPGPDDVIGILVFIPGTQFTMFQVTMIQVYLGEETAWGEGYDDWGKGWAMYFECLPQ